MTLSATRLPQSRLPTSHQLLVNKHLREQQSSIGLQSSAADAPPLKMKIAQVSVVHEDSIAAVEKLVKINLRIPYHQIEASLGLSSASLNKIMHDHLQLRKLSARWIPHLLTGEQKQKRIDFWNFMRRNLTAELPISLGHSHMVTKRGSINTTLRPSASPASGSFPEKMHPKSAFAVGASEDKW